MADPMRLLATIRSKLIDTSVLLIQCRDDQIRWLEKFIKNVRDQELGVNITKTVTTATTVAATVLLFIPPTSIIGGISLAISGLASGVMSVTDFITTKVRSKGLKTLITRSKELENRFEEVQKELRSFLQKLAEKLGVDPKVAEGLVCAEGFIKIGKFYHSVISGTIDIAEFAPKIHQIRVLMKLGHGFGHASKVASAAEVTMVVEGGEAVTQLTGSVVSNVAKGFAVAGAVVSMADMIYSWASGNPNLSSARGCLEQLTENRNKLEEARAFYQSIPN